MSALDLSISPSLMHFAVICRISLCSSSLKYPCCPSVIRATVPRKIEGKAFIRLEGVGVQPDHGQQPGLLQNPLADEGQRGVVELALRQDDGRPSAGFEHFQDALDEEHIALFLRLLVVSGPLERRLGQLVVRQHLAVLHFAGKGRIGENHVEFQFVEIFPGFVIVLERFVFGDLLGGELGLPQAMHQRLARTGFVPGPRVEAADIRAKDIGVTIAGNQHQGARGLGGALLKVDAPEVFGGVFVLAQFALFVVIGGVAPVHGVQQEAAGTAGRVHHILVALRVEHAHAHFDDMARREKLAFLLLGLGGQQVLEGIVHDAQVRAHQAHALDGADAHLKMALGQFDVLACFEDAGPLFAGFVKEAVDAVVGNLGVKRFAELDDLVLAILQRLFLVPDLGEDQLEDFVELVLAAVGQDQFFQVLDDLLEVEVLLELQQGLLGFQHIFWCLPALGDVEQACRRTAPDRAGTE